MNLRFTNIDVQVDNIKALRFLALYYENLGSKGFSINQITMTSDLFDSEEFVTEMSRIKFDEL
jgi:hypothetical protein